MGGGGGRAGRGGESGRSGPPHTRSHPFAPLHIRLPLPPSSPPLPCLPPIIPLASLRPTPSPRVMSPSPADALESLSVISLYGRGTLGVFRPLPAPRGYGGSGDSRRDCPHKPHPHAVSALDLRARGVYNTSMGLRRGVPAHDLRRFTHGWKEDHAAAGGAEGGG